MKAVSGRAGVCLVKSSLQKPTSPSSATLLATSSATQDASACCTVGGVGQCLGGQIVAVFHNISDRNFSQFVVLQEGLVAKKGESVFDSWNSFALQDSTGQKMFVRCFNEKEELSIICGLAFVGG